MQAHVVSSSVGVTFSYGKELRDTRSSVSGQRAVSCTGGIHYAILVACKIVEDLKYQRSKGLQQSLSLGNYSLQHSRVLASPSDSDPVSISIGRKILTAYQPVDLLRNFLDRLFPANLLCWTAEFSSRSLSQRLIILLSTSSLFFYTPTAEAFGFFTPRGTGNVIDKTVSNSLQESEAFRARAKLAIDLLEKGQNAQAEGDFRKALDFYEEVKQTAGDLALAEYARVGHAVTLYEVGDRSEAIIEMEDVSIALRGYPEIHAALAAALYVDKHAPLPAEKQFNIATLLDPRYTNVKWVQETKHWPPSLINSLKRFISLQ